MKLTRLMSGFLMLLLLGVAVGCGSAGEDDGGSSGGGEAAYPSENFWAGFEEVPEERPDNPVVDTAQYKLPAGEKMVIGYSDSSQSNSWRVMAKAETEEGIAKAGAQLVYTNANDSAPKQIADIEDLIAQKVDAIVVSATDVNALCPTIQQAIGAGIPVIIQERAVDCGEFTSFVSLDTVNAGENMMSYIAHRLEGKGQIAIMSGIPGVGHTLQVEEGYENVLADYPEIEVVDKQYGKYDPAQAKQLMSSILVAHPDVEAVGVVSGLMTDGVFEAAKAAGKLDQMKAWTGDDDNNWMKIAVENDLPNLSVPYSPHIGQVAVEVAVKTLKGEEVRETEFVPRWEPAIEFSEHLADFVDFSKPAEWWYSEMSCEFDPFCKA